MRIGFKISKRHKKVAGKKNVKRYGKREFPVNWNTEFSSRIPMQGTGLFRHSRMSNRLSYLQVFRSYLECVFFLKLLVLYLHGKWWCQLAVT